jgi:hypothetical protein
MLSILLVVDCQQPDALLLSTWHMVVGSVTREKNKDVINCQIFSLLFYSR